MDENRENNYEKARQEVLKHINKPLSHPIIKSIHALIDPGIKHEYRSGHNFVPVANNTYSSSSGIICQREMEALLSWYNNSNLSAIEKAARLHWGFVKIHPFEDGNGRLARLLVSLTFLNSDKSDKFCRNLENYFALDRDRYGNALNDGEFSYRNQAYNSASKQWLDYLNEACENVEDQIKEAR